MKWRSAAVILHTSCSSLVLSASHFLAPRGRRRQRCAPRQAARSASGRSPIEAAPPPRGKAPRLLGCLHPGPELSLPRVRTLSALAFRAPGVYFPRECPLWGTGHHFLDAEPPRQARSLTHHEDVSPLLSPSPGLGLAHVLVQFWEEQPNGHFREAKVTRRSTPLGCALVVLSRPQSCHLPGLLKPVSQMGFDRDLFQAPRWERTVLTHTYPLHRQVAHAHLCVDPACLSWKTNKDTNSINICNPRLKHGV